MTRELIIAGFGGQGIMSAGRLLCYASIAENKNVLWLPTYTPEMRGGAAICTVIISDTEIGSPIIENPSAAIALNNYALLQLEPLVKPGGLLIINSSLIHKNPTRKDIRKIKIPATQLAEQLGAVQAANMIALGAYVESEKPVKLESLIQSLTQILPASKTSLITINQNAIKKGAQLVSKKC